MLKIRSNKITVDEYGQEWQTLRYKDGGGSTHRYFRIGKYIRWPRNGCNMHKALVLQEYVDHYLVQDRWNQIHYAWKGCCRPA